MELYKDSSQPVEKRIEDLLKRMTLEEKAAQLCGDLPVELIQNGMPSIEQLKEKFPYGHGRLTQYSMVGLSDPKKIARLTNVLQKYFVEETRLGIPVALQDGFIQVAFMIITVIANSRGVSDAAAVGVVEKVISALFIVPSSMLATVSALSAQNLGAGKEKRATDTLHYATVITTIYGMIVAVLIQFIAENVVGIFTSDTTVVTMGSAYIRSYIWDCIFAGIHFSFSGYFAACGKSYIGFLHNIISITFVRVPGSYLASKYFTDTLYPMGLAAPAGSLVSVAICVTAFILLKKKSRVAQTA